MVHYIAPGRVVAAIDSIAAEFSEWQRQAV
jgi:hypothetical protein